MNHDFRYLGIYREVSHSPGREEDDAVILRAVAERLRDTGADVTLCEAEMAPHAELANLSGAFAMCEQPRSLHFLRRVERSGVTVVNPPPAIENTFRYRTVVRLQSAPVAFPESWIVNTGGEEPSPTYPVWIKRFDFHATQSDDVIFVEDDRAWRDALAAFNARGMSKAVAQEHIPGDLIKFYGVGNASSGTLTNGWFTWFYHKQQTLNGYQFDAAVLQGGACAAAQALGVEVFGGDAIVGADGRPVVIDLNAWPSFALYRDEAAEHIANYLMTRCLRVFDAAVG
jgi:hypothetical protein